MGLFGDLDIAAAEVISGQFIFKPDTVVATVVNAERKESEKDGVKRLQLQITWHIDISGSGQEGKKFTTWDTIPVPDNLAYKQYETDTVNKMRDRLKTRLTAVGIPAREMNSTEPEKLIGCDALFRIDKKVDTTVVPPKEFNNFWIEPNREKLDLIKNKLKPTFGATKFN
jgi:hypothetical protein